MEVLIMNTNKNLKYIFFCLSFAIAFAITGSALAQHEGGLGIKKIQLNVAGKDQLMKIDGMTEDLAKAIVEYREKSGFFKKPEDLLHVPGITNDIYKKLNPQTGVDGDLYCIPKAGSDDEEDEDIPLSPSKC
jgi:competence ComEA-like helix-hairpin-helix protein